jgi:enoyl-CoA hydratase/carnithine racemase
LAVFQLTIEGAIARLRLNRPEARNALPLDGWQALADAAEEAERAGAHLLIVSGTPGGAFCAGADLSAFDGFRDDPEARADFRLAIRSGLDRLRALSIPTLALVEGACYGAGVAVAMACDIRFAGAAAQFAITPAKLGISYPQEDVHRLVRLVGAGQASRLLFSAEAIDGAEAERIGLVERYMAGDIDEAAAQFAAAAAANGLESLKTLKRGVLLAERGIVSDAEQDKIFDDLLGCETMFERLAGHRSRRR